MDKGGFFSRISFFKFENLPDRKERYGLTIRDFHYFAKFSVNRFSFQMTVMPRPMTIMTAAKR